MSLIKLRPELIVDGLQSFDMRGSIFSGYTDPAVFPFNSIKPKCNFVSKMLRSNSCNVDVSLTLKLNCINKDPAGPQTRRV